LRDDSASFDSGMEYAYPRIRWASQTGDNMDRENICLHDAHGYFIGRWVMGHPVRLSVEHFANEYMCLAAIRSKRWTRRMIL